MNFYTQKVLMVGIAAVFLLYGCSSSSSTIRYRTKTNNTTVKDEASRFSSKNTEKNPDSTYITEEIADDNDSEEFPEENSIDISSVMQKLNSGSSHSSSKIDDTQREKLVMEIIKYLGTPYQFGGNTKDGIDCSAFTQTIYSNTFNYPLNRSAREQYTQGTEIEERQELQFGDLVFFNTRRRVRPGHVGIYIGDNLFAHSSTKNGVIVSSLDMDYYSKRFMGGRRIEPVLNSKL